MEDLSDSVSVTPILVPVSETFATVCHHLISYDFVYEESESVSCTKR